MNKCCDCKKETNCKEHKGSHKYCFETKEADKINAKSIGLAMVEKMIRAYNERHKEE